MPARRMPSRSPGSARVNLISMPLSGKTADFTVVIYMSEETFVANGTWERGKKEREVIDPNTLKALEAEAKMAMESVVISTA